MNTRTNALRDMLPDLSRNSETRQSLQDLRERISRQQLKEYTPTGETPQRIQYTFSTTLPRTDPYEVLVAKFRGHTLPTPAESPSGTGTPAEFTRSPSKGMVFTDIPDAEEVALLPAASRSLPGSSAENLPTIASLRELDINVIGSAIPVTAETTSNTPDVVASENNAMPPLKRQNTSSAGSVEKTGGESKLPIKRGMRMTVAAIGAADRENLVNFAASVGPGGGRRLRSQGST